MSENTTQPKLACKFIAHDFAGWMEQYGRYTALPDGQTLVCQPWMGQLDWDKAQYDFLGQFDDAVVVHKCPRGPYRETGDTFGTVAQIRARLAKRLE